MIFSTLNTVGHHADGYTLHVQWFLAHHKSLLPLQYFLLSRLKKRAGAMSPFCQRSGSTLNLVPVLSTEYEVFLYIYQQAIIVSLAPTHTHNHHSSESWAFPWVPFQWSWENCLSYPTYYISVRFYCQSSQRLTPDIALAIALGTILGQICSISFTWATLFSHESCRHVCVWKERIVRGVKDIFICIFLFSRACSVVVHGILW